MPLHIMTLISCLLGRQPCFPTTSSLAGGDQHPPHHERIERNRLKKKEPPPEIFFSCEDLLDTARCEKYLTWRPNQSNATVVYSGHSEAQPLPTNQPSMKPQQVRESTSVYSQYGLKPEELKRTRAKTPVHRIGQLEKKTYDTNRLCEDVDASIIFARQYQAVLPSREATPCPEFAVLSVHRNGLRRVKCQGSLRDLVKNHPETTKFVHFDSSDTSSDDGPEDASPEKSDTSSYFTAENYEDSPRPLVTRLSRSFDSHFSRRHSSDTETLIGSDQGLSPKSPMSSYFSNSHLNAMNTIQNLGVHEDLTMPENDIGMQLAMDLLTNDLATALHRQHPLEPGNRVSGLQILLMIEAYESLQQKLRLGPAHVTGLAQEEEHVSDVMDHWLHALRSIYERSVSRAGRDTQDAATV